jgi:hypothetical protein
VSAVDVSALADPVWALIDAVTGVNTYDGEFVDADGNTIKPPADADGRVHAYAVYYPGAGWAHALLACGGTDSLDWTFQVTCAAGTRVQFLWCVDKIRAALSGATITVGDQALTIRETDDTGPMRRDNDVSPARFYVPLLFAVNA